MQTGPKLVVFDLAGTTVYDDHDVPRVLRTSLQHHGVEITPADAARVMGIPKPIAIRELLEKYEHHEQSLPFVEKIHGHFIAEMIHFYKNDPRVREMPGASIVFDRLKQAGVQVWVDTGFDRSITDTLLQRLGWLDQGLLDGSVTSDEVKQGRPFPDMILHAMHVSGIMNANDVAKVGDTASDLREGTAARCRWVIGVTTGAYTRAQLLNEPHTHLAENLSGVLKILEKKD